MTTTNNNKSNNINFTTLDSIKDLTEKEKWINWKIDSRNGKETKIPIDFSGKAIDATDSTNWMKYEQAKKAVNMNDADGIGFVFSDDDDIMGIDLDDCRDKATGEIDDWAKEVIEEIDTYWEISPSGTGFHGYVKAFLDGTGGKADVDGTNGHIEMYTTERYFTVTGDKYKNSDDYIKNKIKPTQDVYGKYYDTDDEDTKSSTENRDVNIDVHDVLDGNYPEEERISHPIHGSSTGSNFVIDEGGETWRCWRDEVTGNALHLIGMQSGIITCEQHSNDNISNTDWKEIIEEARNRGYDIDDPINTIPDEIYTEIDEWDKKYIRYKETSDGEKYPEEITTFTIELNAILTDDISEDTKLDITINPQSDKFDGYDIVIEPNVFNDVRKFKKQVCTEPSTSFKGNQDDLDELRKIVVHQKSDRMKSTKRIGLHSDEFVTVDGSYSLDGETEYRYEKTGSSIDKKFKLDAEEIGDYDEEEVKEILELVPEIRQSERLLPVLGWYYASLYSPLIREQEGEISQIAVAGDSGSGKSATLEVLQQLVGLDNNPDSANDTPFAMLKKLSSSTNIPIWLDEYKPSDISRKKMDALNDFLRKTTRGSSVSRGNADQTTTNYFLSAPVCISGEETIKGSAERRRFIRTQFTKKARNGRSKESFIELNGGSYEENNELKYFDGYDLKEHAKAIHKIVLEEKDNFKTKWRSAKEKVHKKTTQMRIDGISDIQYVGLTMIKYGISMINYLYSKVGGSGVLIDEKELDKAIEYIGNKMGNSMSHVDEFFEVLSVIEPNENVVHRIDSDDNIRVNVTKSHAEIQKYISDMNVEGAYDTFNNPKDYIKRMNAMVDYDDSYVIDKKNDHELNRCFVIDPEKTEEIIDGFNKENLGIVDKEKYK